MKIILSTRNPSKAEQIKAIFAGTNMEILTLSEASIDGEAIEDGKNLKENAYKKAVYAFAASENGVWSIADDTGLFIPALNNEPGHHAARWAGETATTQEITQYTLEKMKGVRDRKAVFKTVVALISPEGEMYYFSGKVTGWMMESPQAPAQPKMPYSPLFKPKGSDKVWAQMTPDEENAISHRGKAFRKALVFLRKKHYTVH